MANLIVYKASAGSGKTFTLTRECLSLLFRNRDAYKDILAVTFTNKATAEMKGRVLGELYQMSVDPALSGQSAYLVEKGYARWDTLRDRAREILQAILHDYTRFSFETIDSFFQRVLRAFARELGLPAGYNIEIDVDSILEEVTDELIDSMGEDEKLKNWLVNFAEKSMMEGKGWNIQRNLLLLGREISKEHFKLLDKDKEQISKLYDKDLIASYQKELAGLKRDIEEYIITRAKTAMELITGHGLNVDDFKFKKAGVAGYIQKLAQGQIAPPGVRALNAAETTDAWYTGKTDSDFLPLLLDKGLLGLYQEIIEYYFSREKVYNTVDRVLVNLHTLGLLGDISKRMRDHARDKNLLIISDSAYLLHEIIAGNDTPFIYEKMGNRYQYYMIDEFQDTSALQWDNFRPLVQNSIAQGHPNWLVGDIKQSIYRWRNSDWSIMARQVHEEFRPDILRVEYLPSNWRSRENIVKFNNTLFTWASVRVQELFNEGLHDDFKERSEWNHIILDAYDKLCQDVPGGERQSGGIVRVQFVEGPAKENPGEDEPTGTQVGNNPSWKDSVDERLPVFIRELLEQGYEAKDIAILVRKREEGERVARVLLEYKKQLDPALQQQFEVISDDSLLLSASSPVKLMIAVMKYLLNPGDTVNKAMICVEYGNRQKGLPLEGEQLRAMVQEQGEQLMVDGGFCPREFTRVKGKLRLMTVHELSVHLVAIFELADLHGEIPYIQSFQDKILEFSRKSAPDLRAFIEWWDRSGNRSAVSLPKGQNATRVLTIHQSKGLEFPVVIIPYADWKIDHDPVIAPLIWCKPVVAPFDRLPVVPVKYSKELSNTIFAADYYQEKVKTLVDNLNLLYVALTRAESVLAVFAPVPASDDIKSVSGLMHQFLSKEQGYLSGNNVFDPQALASSWDEESTCFDMGKPSPRPKRKDDEMQGMVPLVKPNTAIMQKLQLKLQGKEYFKDTGEPSSLDPDIARMETDQRLDYGKIMHDVFRQINTREDLDVVVPAMQREGKIRDDQVEWFRSKIEQFLSGPGVQKWFDGSYRVVNERDIIFPGGQVIRPDRVMITGNHAVVVDYKFGAEEHEDHVDQVKRYRVAIEGITRLPTKGYIWYVMSGKLIEVG